MVPRRKFRKERKKAKSFVQATYQDYPGRYYIFELYAEDASEADDKIRIYLERKYGLKDDDYECVQLCLDGKDWEGNPYRDVRDDGYPYTLIRL